MSAATQLKGMALPNGWLVEDFATRPINATGGHFSQGYIVVDKDGRKGFLKALDYMKAFDSADTALMLQAMSSAYVFERDLCEKCAHLSRIARAVDSGSIHIDKANPFTKVEYLIFELADRDIRTHLDLQVALDNAFIMRTLHNVTTGLEQLHRAKIAHQDLKPSNVLVYGSSNSTKICDLGRAWDSEVPAPHDMCKIAGDKAYAPLEQLFFATPNEYGPRRFGCDLYHLGSLIVFMYARVHMNALVLENLPVEHRPFHWGGSYDDVLPFVQASFDSALDVFVEHVPQFLQIDLRRVVAELCNPDPLKRGHPRNRWGNQFGLERYISLFDRLSHVARLQLVRTRDA